MGGNRLNIKTILVIPSDRDEWITWIKGYRKLVILYINIKGKKDDFIDMVNGTTNVWFNVISCFYFISVFIIVLIILNNNNVYVAFDVNARELEDAPQEHMP